MSYGAFEYCCGQQGDLESKKLQTTDFNEQFTR